MPKLSEAELGAIIAQQIELAKSHDKSERATSRDKALDYYLGNMDKYVPPEANRSKVVSRDVADTIGWTLPQLRRALLSSDRMAIAEPVSMDDEQFARQATDGMNYVFLKDNDGEQIVYDATWDALLTGNAPIKVYYDDTPVFTTSFHSGLTEDQVALLLQDDDVEVLAQTPREETVVDPASGQPIPVTLLDLKIKRKKLDGTFVIDAIPPEEFLIDSDAIETEEAAFTDHWQRKTRSALVAMGYDKDDVAAIPEASRLATAEASSRDPSANTYEATDTSMQLVEYHECYIRVDVDGDGEAELVRACYGGPGGTAKGSLLDWEVWEDEHPFEDIKCEPIPHRWLARSQADETTDIQDIKTVLTRQLLNNTYWVNNPQRFVQGKIKNPDALDNPVFGQSVFGDVGAVVTDLPVPYIGDKALMALTYIDEVRQARTGVGRQSMALDPEVLQNQTATASNNNKDASYTQVEQYAWNMAAGWRRVFRKLLKLMIKHQTYSRKIMMHGKEVEIDPRFWNADMDVTINVGLGTGSRDRDLMMLQQVLQTQLLMADRFMAAGATEDAIELLPKILMTMTKMAESAGIRNPEDFYPEYTQDKIEKLKQLAAQPKPDPALALEQAKGEVQKELKTVDAQTTLQVEAGKNQLAAQQAEINSAAQVRREQAQLEADLMTKEADRQNAIILAREQGQIDLQKQDRELAFRAVELQTKTELEREKMANAVKVAVAKPKPQPGKGADA